MQLNNEWESFKLQFNGEDYVVPSGKFDCWTDLGKFIIYTARKWGKDVKLSETKAKEINVSEEDSKDEKTPKESPAKESKGSKKGTKK